MSVENLNNMLGSAAVNSFDGFRVIVAKQVNLNAASQHMFMLGSSQTQNAPYYKYTLILPLDDKNEKSVRLSSDLDFNMDGEFNYPLQDKVSLKTEVHLQEQGNGAGAEVDFSDDNSTTQIGCKIGGAANSLSINFMQALTPCFSLGGTNSYYFGKGVSKSSLAALYADEEQGNTFAGTFEFESKNTHLFYKREVNPNRVNLLTDVTYDGASGQSVMNLTAQYKLKQSSITMGFDSDLTLRSTVESNIAQGVQLTISAEIPHLNQGACKFGYCLLMG